MQDPTFLLWTLAGLILGVLATRRFDRRRVERACRRVVDPGTDLDPRDLSEPFSTLAQDLRDRLDAVRREHAIARRVASEQADRSSRALQGLEDPVLIVEPDGEVVEHNLAATRLARCEAGRTIRRMEELVSSPVVARELGDLIKGLAEATFDVVRRTSFTIPAEDSSTGIRDFSVSLRRLDDADRVLVVMHETTREREIARIKSEFVAKASHELRTPLSSIRATLEMLEEGDLEDPATRSEMLSIAMEETIRLAGLVEDMLDISRIEAGVARPRIEAVDLCDLASEVVDGLRAVADRKSIDLSLRRRDEGLVVEGDREMLATVIGNLAGNALKYVPDGERVVVEVAPDDLTRSVVVTVTDTGLGIPPDDVPRIFEKFYRVSRYERRARGSGLGLDLCRNIVEEVHQGRIGVDSTIGEGSRFWFGVPAKHASTMAA